MVETATEVMSFAPPPRLGTSLQFKPNVANSLEAPSSTTFGMSEPPIEKLAVFPK